MTALDQDVLVEVVDGVATVSLNRPDKLNAVTPEMAARLGDHLRAVENDPGVRAVVLTGRGRGFCSGADLAVLGAGPQSLAGFVTDPATFPVLDLRKPLIAAVNGPVAGVGMAYITGADIRFAAATATFTTSFAPLGLIAEYGLAWLLPRLIGQPAATDLLLSGRTIGAQEANRLGLVSAVLAPDELLAHATAYARDLARRCSPRSMAIIKQQLRDDPTRDVAFHRSLELMVESFEAPDLAEAIRARTERRPPAFPPLEQE